MTELHELVFSAMTLADITCRLQVALKVQVLCKVQGLLKVGTARHYDGGGSGMRVSSHES